MSPLARWPDLKFVSVESGMGWLPYLIDRMDYEYQDQYRDLKLKMLPSEYWRRQCKATFQFDRIGTKLIDDMGVETLMWGSDYPHAEGVFPDSQMMVEKQFAGVPENEIARMTFTQAREIFAALAG